jgi:hypothetical protein
VREAAAKLFPMWQAVLVGAPIALIVGSLLGLTLALAVSLSLGKGNGTLSNVLLVVGQAIGVWLVVRWMKRRRADFAMLVRSGELVPPTDAADPTLGAVSATIARVALGSLGATVAQIYGGPILRVRHGGEILEIRSVADARGRFRIPELVLVERDAKYVALFHRSGWMAPQRVLRRSPAA